MNTQQINSNLLCQLGLMLRHTSKNCHKNTKGNTNMDKTKLRDKILQAIKNDNTQNMTSVELDGNFFAGADIAITCQNSHKNFRIIIIESNE